MRRRRCCVRRTNVRLDGLCRVHRKADRTIRMSTSVKCQRLLWLSRPRRFRSRPRSGPARTRLSRVGDDGMNLDEVDFGPEGDRGLPPAPVCCAGTDSRTHQERERQDPSDRGSHSARFAHLCAFLLGRVAAVDHDVLDDPAPIASERRGMLVSGDSKQPTPCSSVGNSITTKRWKSCGPIDLVPAASRKNPASVLRDDRRHEVRVLLVLNRIGDLRASHPVPGITSPGTTIRPPTIVITGLMSLI